MHGVNESPSHEELRYLEKKIKWIYLPIEKAFRLSKSCWIFLLSTSIRRLFNCGKNFVICSKKLFIVCDLIYFVFFASKSKQAYSASASYCSIKIKCLCFSEQLLYIFFTSHFFIAHFFNVTAFTCGLFDNDDKITIIQQSRKFKHTFFFIIPSFSRLYLANACVYFAAFFLFSCLVCSAIAAKIMACI